MTYNEICISLANAEIENNRGETAMLICHFCNVTKADLLLRRDEDFDSPELAEAVQKRCQHYPLQYILGYWDFCNETYKVTENTLIPRQDTEKLVELAIKLIPENARIIDLCTGSGCVAISTLAARHDCHAVAVDLFAETLAVARENAEANGVGDRMGFLAQDVLYPAFMDSLGTFDAIVSNPPYIPESDRALMRPNVTEHEPDIALFVEDSDPLVFYRAIARTGSKMLAENGRVYFEIYESLVDEMVAMLESEGYVDVVVREDFRGKPRMICARVSSTTR